MKFISFTDKNNSLNIFNIDHIITCHVTDSDIYILTSPGSNDENLYHFKKEDEPNFTALHKFFTSKLVGDYRIY